MPPTPEEAHAAQDAAVTELDPDEEMAEPK